MSAPNAILMVIRSTNITLKWDQQCNMNPAYELSCQLLGLNYTIVLTVNEETTSDFENVSEDKYKSICLVKTVINTILGFSY